MPRSNVARNLAACPPAFLLGSLAGFWVGVVASAVTLVWPEGLLWLALLVAAGSAWAWWMGTR